MHRLRQVSSSSTILRDIVLSAVRRTPESAILSSRHLLPAALSQLSCFPKHYGVLVDYGLLPAEEEEVQEAEEVIMAITRPTSGKINAKKERKAGRCPSIVYECNDGHLGGHKQLISVDSQQILRMMKKYGRRFFLSRTFELEIVEQGPAEWTTLKRERVLPRQVHQHASKDHLLNVTFLRAPPEARIKVEVPLVFLGEDACVGIRKGGFLNTILRGVKFECPGDSIPPFIEVDLSNLNIGEKVLVSDLQVPPHLKLVQGDPTAPVCKIGGRTGSGD